MEDNLHKDKLDDFVRRSFEAHEEEPPEDMWARVETELLPPESSRPPGRVWAWKALAVGVIALLLSMLVCEHLYYEGKIRELKHRENPAAAEGVEKQVNTPVVDAESKRGQQSVAPATPQAVPAPTSGLQTEGQRDAQISQRSNPVVLSNRSIQGKNSMLTTGSPSEQTAPSALLEPQNPSEFHANVPVLPPVEAVEVGLPSTVVINWVAARDAELSGHARTVQPPHTNPIPPIKPQRKPSEWYTGASVAMLWAAEQQRPPIPRLNRPAFASRRERESSSMLWGLGFGKKLGHGFSLETGLAYQKITQSATHTARFRFRDGTPMAMRRNFEYDLSTYGGMAEVSLRMEMTPGLPPSDDEPVVLRIATEHRIEMLRIPLLARFEYGKGRLNGHFKAGVLGNVVVGNELDISARTSQNARFQPVAGKDGYTVQLSKGKFFWGYWLSAGAEYQLGHGLGVFAEPVLLGDFPRSDQQRRSLPERVAYGLNVGARLNF